MRITSWVGAALVAGALVSGCGGRTPGGSPAVGSSVVTPTAAPTTTTTTTTTTTVAAPGAAELDQLMTNLDSQLAAVTKSLDDATAAIDGGEGDVNL